MPLSDSGRTEGAEACLRRAADLDPANVNASVALGVALGRMHRYKEAVDALRSAVDQDERNPWAQRNLGAMLFTDRQTGRSHSAFRDRRTVAAKSPGWSKVAREQIG